MITAARSGIDDFITPAAVESIYRVATHELRALPTAERHRLFAQTKRALQARDTKLLHVLDRGAEILRRMADDQWGRTNRTADTAVARVPPTEATIWREAYRLADEGTALADNDETNFIELYTAAGLFCRVVTR